MNTIQKSETIKNGLRKGFQDGSSKMVKRKCYGYTINSDGELEINLGEARVVSWIFEQYLAGDSLGKIAAGLERKGIPSPTGRLRWNREAIDKLLSNEKYTGRVLLQKAVSTGAVQIENDGLMERYLYTGSHEAIISDEIFMAVRQEKFKRAKNPENMIGMSFTFMPNGDVFQTKIGPDGKAIMERHHTVHHRPDKHTDPHDHEIRWETFYIYQTTET